MSQLNHKAGARPHPHATATVAAGSCLGVTRDKAREIERARQTRRTNPTKTCNSQLSTINTWAPADSFAGLNTHGNSR
jgi:hypothetical protein